MVSHLFEEDALYLRKDELKESRYVMMSTLYFVDGGTITIAYDPYYSSSPFFIDKGGWIHYTYDSLSGELAFPPHKIDRLLEDHSTFTQVEYWEKYKSDHDI